MSRVCMCINPHMCVACLSNELPHNFIGYSKPVHTNNQQGWSCSKCGRVNAPWMPYCCMPKGDKS